MQIRDRVGHCEMKSEERLRERKIATTALQPARSVLLLVLHAHLTCSVSAVHSPMPDYTKLSQEAVSTWHSAGFGVLAQKASE